MGTNFKIAVKSPIGKPVLYSYDIEDWEWLRDKLDITKKEMARILGKSRCWYQQLAEGRWNGVDQEVVDRLYAYCASRGVKLTEKELEETPLVEPPAPKIDQEKQIVDLRNTTDYQPKVSMEKVLKRKKKDYDFKTVDRHEPFKEQVKLVEIKRKQRKEARKRIFDEKRALLLRQIQAAKQAEEEEAAQEKTLENKSEDKTEQSQNT